MRENARRKEKESASAAREEAAMEQALLWTCNSLGSKYTLLETEMAVTGQYVFDAVTRLVSFPAPSFVRTRERGKMGLTPDFLVDLIVSIGNYPDQFHDLTRISSSIARYFPF